jgi:hypothetical protein
MEHAPIATKPSHPSCQLSPRAMSIARGLRRTGRVGDLRGKYLGLEADEQWLTLEARDGGYYFLSLDGAVLMRGPDVSEALELQAGFVDAMARIGAKIVVEPATS